MFNFIKEKISEITPPTNTPPDDSETILEYAHLFQELDDLSMKGTDEDKARPMEVDIPLDDDIEIESIELNLSDGRITDIPMDAKVQESNYDVMKTFDDFYQEACRNVSIFTRESEDGLENRRIEYANKAYNKYKNRIIQEGLFGFDKMDLNDDRIPSKMMIDFGPISASNSNPYTVKLEILWEVDRNKKVMKKQLESLNVATTYDIFIGLAKVLDRDLREQYPDKMKNAKSVWDVATPVKLLIPVNPIDKYAISVGFECDFVEDLIYYTWSKPIKSAKKNKYNKEEFIDPSCFKKHRNPIDDSINYKTTRGFTMRKIKVEESFSMDLPSRFGSPTIYQEAIDFGNVGDSTTPPDNVDNKEEPSVSVDNNDTQTTEPTSDEGNTETVDSNNVSDEIAQKVADEDGSNTDDTAVTDIPVEDDINTDTSVDDSNVDEQIDNLDDMGNTDMSLDEGTDNIDVDNMTIDELLEQGSEKLKGMTIQQLKDFLSSAGPDQIQEAFIPTKKNTNKEIYIRIKNLLGILNDSEMDISTLTDSFKKEGKKLNKAIDKAIKRKKDYTEDDIKEMIKLNKCLVDLMTVIDKGSNKSYVATIKRLIKAFTSQCVVVSKIVESGKLTSES